MKLQTGSKAVMCDKDFQNRFDTEFLDKSTDLSLNYFGKKERGVKTGSRELQLDKIITIL